MQNLKSFRSALALLTIVGGVFACSASGVGTGVALPASDAGDPGTEPDDASKSSDSPSPREDGSVPNAGGISITNLSYGGSDYIFDVTFSMTGSAQVAKVTEVTVAFADGSVKAFAVQCAAAPWTSPSAGLVELQTSLSGLTYPCDGVTSRASGSFPRVLGSPDLTVTLKGISKDASPWSVSATGKKR